MRRLGWVLVVLLILLGGAATWALFGLNRFLNDNRAWIQEQARAASGRDVTFGEIGVSLRDGVGARLADVVIGEDPSFGEEPFVTAGAARVRMALWPALFGRFEIAEVVLEQPTLRLVRTDEGWNVETLGKGSEAPVEEPAQQPPAEDTPSPSEAPPLVLLVALASLKDGRVEIVDRRSQPATEWTVQALDVTVAGVGGADPIEFEISAAAMADEPNIWGEGTVALGDREIGLVARLDVRGVPLSQGDTSWVASVESRVDVDVLEPGSSRPALRGSVVVENGEVATAADPADRLRGVAAQIELPGTGFDASGRLDVSSGEVRAIEFESFTTNFAVTGEVATFSDLTVELLGGSYGAEGRYAFPSGGTPSFELRQTLDALDVGALLASQSEEGESLMTGRLSGRLDLGGAGGDGETLRQSLRGSGEVAVADGVLARVNLPDLLLESLTGVRGLTDLLSDEIREKYAELLEAKDTPFDDMSATLQIEGGRATTEDAVITARDYSLRGAGSIESSAEVDFTATFVASKTLTEDFVHSVRETKYLTDDDGRIDIPARIVGQLPDVRIEPDPAYVSRVLARGVVGTGLRLLGGDEPRPSPGADAEGESAEARPEDVGTELLERGLRQLFGAD